VKESFVDLDALAQHSASRVRAIVAADPDTPPDLLRSLIVDDDISVKMAAALNPACPSDILRELCSDPSPAIRLGLASQLDLSDEILMVLVTHKNPYLADQAKYGLAAALFERKIEERGIELIAGSEYKLGSLLVASKHLSEDALIAALDLARKLKLRIGRVLLQTGQVRPSILTEALRLQELLRKHRIELTGALKSLADS
jgi:hypothetical protein